MQDLTSKLNIAQSDAEAYEKALGASKSAAEEVKHANKLLQAQQVGAWSLELSAVTCELQSAYQQVEVLKTELITFWLSRLKFIGSRSRPVITLQKS